MRRLGSVLLAAALALSLTACGGERAPFDPEDTVRRLMETQGVFSERLEPLEEAVARAQYGLEDYEGAEVASCRSTGATAEEVAVIRFAAEAEARAYESRAADYLDEQREANADYRPQEMPKLERAVAQRRGATFLILVAADYDAAEPVLG